MMDRLDDRGALRQHLPIVESQHGKTTSFKHDAPHSIDVDSRRLEVLAPSISTINLASRQAESAMNGPTGCWRRNL
jgi:hypothetical protein